jgi:predicted  nucleic acid-binding Zn-ribbon protein
MNLQHRVQELNDMDVKCSEINLALRQFKEKYDALVCNSSAYSEEGDVAYLRRRIADLQASGAAAEGSLSSAEEANKKLTEDVVKYKSGIRKVAKILTQQEEIIKKYEVCIMSCLCVFFSLPYLCIMVSLFLYMLIRRRHLLESTSW